MYLVSNEQSDGNALNAIRKLKRKKRNTVKSHYKNVVNIVMHLCLMVS